MGEVTGRGRLGFWDVLCRGEEVIEGEDEVDGMVWDGWDGMDWDGLGWGSGYTN